MDDKYWEHLPRTPRHQTADTAELRVEIERTRGTSVTLVAAELLDISRGGIRLRAALPLRVGEAVTVQLHAEQSEIDLAMPCTVRWRRLEDNGLWSVGCALARQVDWESLGKLFLNGILAMEVPSSQFPEQPANEREQPVS